MSTLVPYNATYTVKNGINAPIIANRPGALKVAENRKKRSKHPGAP